MTPKELLEAIKLEDQDTIQKIIDRLNGGPIIGRTTCSSNEVSNFYGTLWYLYGRDKVKDKILYIYKNAPEYLPIKIQTYAKKLILETKFNATAKHLQPNEFSYTVFESYLKQQNKKLTGKDACRYLNKIHIMKNLPEDLFYKYVNLIWNYSNITIQLYDQLKDMIYSNTKYDIRWPVSFINHLFVGVKDIKLAVLSISFYINIANKYNISMPYYLASANESTVYTFIPSIKPTKPFSEMQIQIALSQLDILNIFIKEVKATATNYAWAIAMYDQIKEILFIDNKETTKKVLQQQTLLNEDIQNHNKQLLKELK